VRKVIGDVGGVSDFLSLYARAPFCIWEALRKKCVNRNSKLLTPLTSPTSIGRRRWREGDDTWMDSNDPHTNLDETETIVIYPETVLTAADRAVIQTWRSQVVGVLKFMRPEDRRNEMGSAQLGLFAGLTDEAVDQHVRLTPPLKWAGGKTWQVPHVEPLWHSHRHRRFVEPFCGGLGMALGLMPESAFLNDVNPHLINLYGWLRQGLHVDLPMENHERLFYEHRDRFNKLLSTGNDSSREAGALFYYLNRTCFNGLCRFNRTGEFNVPFGSYKTINYKTDFSAYVAVLSRWQFTSHDFESVELDAKDFVYADPPYDVEFTTYAKEGFSWRDQVRVAEWLACHPGPVVLSNQATPRILELYRRLGFELTYLSAPRRISCTGDRTPAREVLAVRNVRGWS
jgi:DNA adenine methylase